MHMGPGFSVDMMPLGFGIIPIIMFLIWLAFVGLGIYVIILVIKALKKYIQKD